MELVRCALLSSLLLVHFLRFGSARAVKDDARNTTEYDSIVGMWCPVWRNMMCGNDGVSYWNECLFRASSQIRPGLEVIKPGSCEELECDDCDDDEGVDLDICGTNGQTFSSRCLLECYQETYPKLEERYKHCEYKYPTPDEVNNATSDVYSEVVDAYFSRYLDIVHEYKFENLTFKKVTFPTEVGGEEIKVVCKKGSLMDLSTFKRVEPLYFYSYSGWEPRVKIVFELEQLDLKIHKFTANGGGHKVKGKLNLNVGKNRFELIATIKASEKECPLFEPLSLRLTHVETIDVVLDPPLPEGLDATVDGLIKEKFVTVVNSMLSPKVVPKLTEVGCLKAEDFPGEGHTPRCYGFFQMKVCF